MSANFAELLDRKADQAKRPPPIPAGTYEAEILGHDTGVSSKKQTPYLQMNFKLLAPMDDVDVDAFEEFGGQAKLMKKALNEKFYLTEDAEFRLREFFENSLGMDITGKTFLELSVEAKGDTVLIEIGNEASTRDSNLWIAVTKGFSQSA